MDVPGFEMKRSLTVEGKVNWFTTQKRTHIEDTYLEPFVISNFFFFLTFLVLSFLYIDN